MSGYKTWILITTLWIPLGRVYMVLWTIWRTQQLPWFRWFPRFLLQLFTERIYRIMLLESGIFGLSTPFFNHFIRKRKKIKDGTHNPADSNKST
jgi:hypothetical protein